MNRNPLSAQSCDAPAASALTVRGLGHSYNRVDGPVLADIDLDIAAGEIVALLGRSGSGKSTLLHMLAGLVMPTTGEVRINGAPVRGPSPKWVMMFQTPSLFPWLSVAENAALGLKFTGQMAAIDTRIPEVLRLVDLGDFAARNAQDLSGGQQQRVALARSLAPRPELLLLDEPFSALDAFTRRALQRDVRRIARDLGLTLVIVTHDVGEAVLMADRVVLMESGPGRIAGDLAIPLNEAERDTASPAFAREHARLLAAYARIAAAGADDVLTPTAAV